MDSDVKTRVTPLEDIRSSSEPGHDCVVIYYASDSRLFGRRYVLASEALSLGRGSENVVVLENDSVSRRHARIERRQGGFSIMDLDSTNGTYVNDTLVTEHALKPGDQIKIGDTILKFLSGSDVEVQYHETIYKMTIVDGLTGANNKRYLLEALEREVQRAKRYKRPLSFLMLDVDHFKNINDSFGHLAGDYVLKELATAIRTRLRPDDVLGRYGGEEFGSILPETGPEGAMTIAEELRRLIEEQRFVFDSEPIPVTISIGVACYQEGQDVEGLVKAADERLYKAKHAGRNRVCD